jgi:Holliday junction resolvasome RuvABC endonuclease subunit
MILDNKHSNHSDGKNDANEIIHSAPSLSILALDLGTTTGWALNTPGTPITHGFVSFKSQRFEGGGMRYLRFGRWLDEIKASVSDVSGQGPFRAVYFEEVRRHLGVDAAHVYGGLLATLTAWCERYQIPYQGVPVGTIKRHATGRGKASKGEVIDAMKRLGHVVADDNEADALALLHCVTDVLSQGVSSKGVSHA